VGNWDDRLFVEWVDESLKEACHRRSSIYSTDWDALPVAHA